jgi:hypothetical protein
MERERRGWRPSNLKLARDSLGCSSTRGGPTPWRAHPSRNPVEGGSGRWRGLPMLVRWLDYDLIAVVVLIFGIGAVSLLALNI